MSRTIPSKEFVLAEIARVAKHLGRVPGKKVFEDETGLNGRDFLGRYWVNWGDAVSEAGLIPNELRQAYPLDDLLEILAERTIKLGRLPTHNELRFDWRNIPDFPHPHAFGRRLGPKDGWLKLVHEFAKRRKEFAAVTGVAPICDVPKESVHIEKVEALGIVYLYRERKYFKIGRTNHLGRRDYELGVQLPEALKLIHQIRTDDPVGIEAYWHKRFEEKRVRQNAEWFDLNEKEVSAFKARKFM